MPSSFFASFLAGDTAATSLLPCRPTDEAAWLRSASAAGERSVAPALLDELRRQSAALPRSLARERHLDALAQPGSSVVVTGQQVGLFLGPLYTLHKAATAVARAQLVTERTGRPCIPLFWLQTEDHDHAEIAHAALPGHQFALPPEDGRVSLAQRTLPAQIDSLVAELRDVIAHLHHGAEVGELLARHYQPGCTYGAAFAGVLAELFPSLVLLDPRTPAVSRLAAPVLARALERHDAIAQALQARGEQLRSSSFDEQVHTRADASLVFFHPQGPAGPRYRLTREGSATRGESADFATPEGHVTLAELRAQLERDPLWFSTSALLRPLVQDTLLPTCAYVGGPAECTYFAQLPPLYELFGVRLPLIAPRARLRVVDGPTRSLCEKLQLRPEDTELPREELLSRVAVRPEGLPHAGALKTQLLAGLQRELDGLEALHLDDDAVRRTRETCAHAVSRLVERIEKAALQRDRTAVERLDRLLLWLRPDGMPQERVYAFPQLAARVGPRELVAALVEAARPLDPAVRSVEP